MGAATDQSEHGPAAWPRRACDGVVQHEAEQIIGQLHHDAARGRSVFGSPPKLRQERAFFFGEMGAYTYVLYAYTYMLYAYTYMFHAHLYVTCTQH